MNRRASDSPIRVLCVDDDDLVAAALRRQLTADRGFEWLGSIHNTDHLSDDVRIHEPDVVLLDSDMVGPDAFDATDRLARDCPRSRVVMVSNHVRPELIDRAIDSGAWGYLSKQDAAESIIEAVREAAAGTFVLKGESRRRYGRE